MLIVYMELRKVSEDLIISDKEYREIQIITEDDELIVSILLYDRMQWKLAEFFLSIGAEEVNGKVKMNWNIVPRATGRAIIEQRADRKDPNKKYNHVKKFLPKAKKEYKAGSF